MLKTFSHLPLTFPLCSILFCGCHIRFVFASLKTHCQMCHTEVIVRVVLFPRSFTVISPDTMRVPLVQSGKERARGAEREVACSMRLLCLLHCTFCTWHNAQRTGGSEMDGGEESNGTWRVSAPTFHHPPPTSQNPLYSTHPAQRTR